MGYHALSCVSEETDSQRAGTAIARAIRDGFGAEPLAAVIVYASVNHDQARLARAVQEAVGPGVAIIGCSAQGVMTKGAVLEGGYVAGAIGLGGEHLAVASARVDGVAIDSGSKGRTLARELVARLGREPKMMLMLYDPVGGVDVNSLLGGAREVVSAPLVGGAASGPPGFLVGTYQYHDGAAFSGGAVALGLAGDFSFDLGVCHGTSPTGIAMTLTRAEGNKIYELDGRPALDVWRETVGCDDADLFNKQHTMALAMGIERRVVSDGQERPVYLIRAIFGFDRAAKAVVVQTAIPEGSKLMFHQRAVNVVKEGTWAMADDLRARLGGKRPWAVLGFECGARTAPFLGPAETLDENLTLQQVVAPQAPWLGLLAWGEIAPCGGEPEFHNYTYPLVVLSH